ncbi:MAG: glycosyltransferase family 39 protein [Phototrophicaceae bacterium]
MHKSMVAYVLILFVGVGIRLNYLARAMYADEAYTFLTYASQSIRQIIQDYSQPNNHILHSIGVHLVTDVLGSSPVSIRLVAFIAGVLLLPCVYELGRMLYAPRVGLWGMAICSGLPALIMYSVNARGYSMVVLCFIVLAMVGVKQLQHARRGGWWLYGGIASLGFFTIPVMLYPVAWVSFWLVLEIVRARQWHNLRGILTGLTFGAVLTVLWYIPVLRHSGLDALLNHGWITRVSWGQAIQQTPELWGALRSLLFWHPWMNWVMGLGVMVGILTHGKMSTTHFSLAIGGITLPILVWITRTYPYPRTWLFVLPILALLMSVGFLRLFTRYKRDGWFDGAAVLVAVGLCAWVMMSGVIYQDRETGDAYGAHEALADIQRLTPPTAQIGIVANPHLEYALRYYITQTRWQTPPELLFVEWETYVALVETLDEQHRLFIITHGVEIPTLEHHLAYLDSSINPSRYRLIPHESYFNGRASLWELQIIE